MAFDMIDRSTLHPLCNDDDCNALMGIPSPIPKFANLHSPSRMSRNYNYYKNLQRRRTRKNKYLNSRTHSLSHSLSTSILLTPPPQTPYTNDIIHNNSNINGNTTHLQPPSHRYKKKKRKRKRRTRTFYKKSWGNRLYGLTNKYSNNISPAHASASASVSPSSPPSTPVGVNNINFRINTISDLGSNSEIIDDADDGDVDDDDDDDLDISLDDGSDGINHHSSFKIFVSGPSSFNIYDKSIQEYLPSDIETATLTECISTDDDNTADDDDDDDNITDNNAYDNDDESDSDANSSDEELYKTGLFLSNNNLNVGIYSVFPYNNITNSDTEWYSAQSDGICRLNEFIQPDYYKRNKNIRFKDQLDMNDNYLNTPSDNDELQFIYPDSPGLMINPVKFTNLLL